MNREELIEEVAKILQSTNDGMDNVEFSETYGAQRRAWGCMHTDYTDNEGKFLSEWERDDYRFQAKAVLDFIDKENAIKPEKRFNVLIQENGKLYKDCLLIDISSEPCTAGNEHGESRKTEALTIFALVGTTEDVPIPPADQVDDDAPLGEISVQQAAREAVREQMTSFLEIHRSVFGEPKEVLTNTVGETC